jgi:hypothetical protein
MRKLVLGMAALAACGVGASALAEDLEILDQQIAGAFAQALSEAAEKIEKPQVKISPDVDKATGVHKEQTGLIVVPQKDITPENEAVNSDPGAPLAHLFMSPNFTPVIDGKAVDPSKLRVLTFTGQDGNEHKVHYLALAARHTDDDVWHLYGYGSGEKPLLDVQIGEGTGPGTEPLALEVKEFEDNKGTAYLTIFDRYQCNFKLNYKEEAAN